jgi:hypothetical protein
MKWIAYLSIIGEEVPSTGAERAASAAFFRQTGLFGRHAGSD